MPAKKSTNKRFFKRTTSKRFSSSNNTKKSVGISLSSNSKPKQEVFPIEPKSSSPSDPQSSIFSSDYKPSTNPSPAQISDEQPADLSQQVQKSTQPQDVQTQQELTQPQSDFNNDTPAQTPSQPASMQTEVDELKKLIEQAKAKISHLEASPHEAEEPKIEQSNTPQVSQDTQSEDVIEAAPQPQDPEKFDGINTEDEKTQMIDEQINYVKRENAKLKHQLDLVKADFEKERDTFKKTIKNLKSELHRTQPVQENKFFSLSKDLREAVQSIKDLADSDIPDLPQPILADQIAGAHQPKNFNLTQSPPVVSADNTPPTPNSPPKIEEQPPAVDQTQTSNPVPPTEEKESAQPPQDQKKKTKAKLKEKKLLITGAAVIAILSLSGLASFKITSKPKIDQKLVDDVLEGQVQGIQMSGELPSAKSKVNEGVDKHADTPFDDIDWQLFEEQQFGMNVQYPHGLTERLHSEASITFLRKDSYLLKVQKIAVPLEVEEYWEQNKANYKTYNATETTFRNQPALLLENQEPGEFANNRYLLKVRDKIVDVSYPVSSPGFNENDMQMVDKMLNTLNLY